MAIAFDASSFDSGTTGTTHTLSHTCTGTNRLLVVTAFVTSISDLITGITYNGVSMTRIQWINNGSTEGFYMYYLLNPSIGANNIVATTSSSSTVYLQNASYTGVSATGQPNVSNTSAYTNSLTTQSTSVTTTVDNCWTVGIFRSGVNQTAIAGTTLRTGVNLTLQIGDSNGPKTPAGSTSLGTTFSSSFSAQIVASFSPAIITLNTDLISYYKLDANSNDSLGTNNMTEANISYVTGKISNGASFNGSTSTMRNSTIALATGTSPYSINLWVKMNVEIASGVQTFSFLGPDATLQDTQYSLSYEYNGGTRRLSMEHYYNGPETYWPLYSAQTLGTANWNMLTVTYSGSSMIMYLNGTSVVSGGGGGTYGSNAGASYQKGFTIGSNYSASTYGARSNAIIDEVGFWNRALTTTEIAQLYGSGVGFSYPFGQPAVKALVIGGGGAGGGTTGNGGGGGGAGEFVYDTAVTVTPQAYTVTIGAGGVGVSNNQGGSGGNTTFATKTALGGGGGGGGIGAGVINGGNGGSGGGAGPAGTAGTSTASQGTGFAGGASASATSGGGGASAVGANGTAAAGGTGGAGGNGTANSISGASVTYSGGGGGGYTARGLGGTGGGGNGEAYNSGNGSVGTANTGGGGGGVSRAGAAAGYNGGSGLLIISYATDGSDGVSPTSTGGTITTSGGQTIHTFTTSGTFTMVAFTSAISNPNFLIFV